MRFDGSKIIFENCDNAFIKKFGLIECGEMVQNFRSVNNIPFIYDTDQLVSFLSIRKSSFFKMFKEECSNNYVKKVIKKRSGEDRILHAPDALLKQLQSRILRQILSKLPVSKYATAYKCGIKLSDNAKPHVGKRYILKMDITDFFGSIRFEQVYSAAFNTKYFPKQIGVMLTTLCCYNGVLPQGAPTSPALSNLVLKNFDNNIGTWCKKHGIAYTRYCDDLTFSSDKPLYNVYEKVNVMLEDSGFTVNEKKTVFSTNASRLSVTGLTVNKKVSVSRQYKRNLRQEVYYALKFGLAKALNHAVNSDIASTETYKNHLVGCINYVLQIEPENKWFKEILHKVNSLPC